VDQQTVRNRRYHRCGPIPVEAIVHSVFYRIPEAGAGDEEDATMASCVASSVAAPVSEKVASDPGGPLELFWRVMGEGHSVGLLLQVIVYLLGLILINWFVCWSSHLWRSRDRVFYWLGGVTYEFFVV
jgi:hypothetical protein